tara:strand:- start:978 stop:1331 length:354 start_codon:yes stop_codon:yes gene_type:complete
MNGGDEQYTGDDRRREHPITRKNGEVNGSFGKVCNKIMQVGGAATVALALPIAAFIGITVVDNNNRSILTEQKLVIFIEHQRSDLYVLREGVEKQTENLTDLYRRHEQRHLNELRNK